MHDFDVYGNPISNKEATQQENKRKRLEKWKKNLAIVTMVAVIVTGLLAVGYSFWGWFGGPNGKAVPEDRGLLATEYVNPSENFKAYFPTQPNVIDVGTIGFPIVNYYSIDQVTGDSYNVSHFRNVTAILGMDAQALLELADKDLLQALLDTNQVQDGVFMILKNEKTSTGREIEARIINETTGQLSDYRMIARGDQLMIVSADGNIERQKDYENYLKWFSWLSTADNKDGYNAIPTDVMGTEGTVNKIILQDGTEVDATPELLQQLNIQP